MLLRGSSTGIRADAVTNVVPAVQWAQSAVAIHLLIRYTTKRHGPVAVANVDDAQVDLQPEMVSFDAKGRGKPLVFELRLPLAHRILPEASSWSFEGRGQLTLTLQKEVNASWKQVSPVAIDGERRGSVSTWFEMQDSIDKEAKKEAKKEDKEKTATKQEGKESKDKKAVKEERKEKTGGKRGEKKTKGVQTPGPGDGWLAWLTWARLEAERAARKAWRRFVKWVRGLFG